MKRKISDYKIITEMNFSDLTYFMGNSDYYEDKNDTSKFQVSDYTFKRKWRSFALHKGYFPKVHNYRHKHLALSSLVSFHSRYTDAVRLSWMR